MGFKKGHKLSKKSLQKLRTSLKGKTPWNKLDRTTRNCPYCAQKYDVPIKESVGAGYRKYCSRSCCYRARRGNWTPWNAGKKTGIVPSTAFKKGFKPWNTGLTLEDPRILRMTQTRRSHDDYKLSEKN